MPPTSSVSRVDPGEWLAQRPLLVRRSARRSSGLFDDPPEDEAKPDKAETPAPKKRKARTTNILALVTHINTTEAWRGALKFNLLTETIEVCPPFPPQSGAKEAPRPLSDPHDVLLATMYFQANGFPRAGKGVVWDAMNAVAHANSYHPVRDYLAGLTWDGTPRVRTLFQHYFARRSAGRSPANATARSPISSTSASASWWAPSPARWIQAASTIMCRW